MNTNTSDRILTSHENYHIRHQTNRNLKTEGGQHSMRSIAMNMSVELIFTRNDRNQTVGPSAV